MSGTTSTVGNATAPTTASTREALVTRLYDTVFDRAPDAQGLAFWTAALGRGATPDAIADALVASQEFQTRYGALADADFVRTLYRNGLEREAEPEGLAFWTGGLQRRATDRGDEALDIAESPEGVASALTQGVATQTGTGTQTTAPGTGTGTGATTPTTDGTGTGTGAGTQLGTTTDGTGTATGSGTDTNPATTGTTEPGTGAGTDPDTGTQPGTGTTTPTVDRTGATGTGTQTATGATTTPNTDGTGATGTTSAGTQTADGTAPAIGTAQAGTGTQQDTDDTGTQTAADTQPTGQQSTGQQGADGTGTGTQTAGGSTGTGADTASTGTQTGSVGGTDTGLGDDASFSFVQIRTPDDELLTVRVVGEDLPVGSEVVDTAAASDDTQDAVVFLDGDQGEAASVSSPEWFMG